MSLSPFQLERKIVIIFAYFSVCPLKRKAAVNKRMKLTKWPENKENLNGIIILPTPTTLFTPPQIAAITETQRTKEEKKFIALFTSHPKHFQENEYYDTWRRGKLNWIVFFLNYCIANNDMESLVEGDNHRLWISQILSLRYIYMLEW